MATSSPFKIPSEQLGIWQVAPLQTREAQSLSPAQVRPSAQGAQPGPQSMSLSLPFKIPSLHEGAAQVPPVHSLLRQSVSARQRLPVLQGVQMRPPQSTSVSSPLVMLSPQSGKTGAFLPQPTASAARTATHTATAQTMRMRRIYH
jgi:hypothetical protein